MAGVGQQEAPEESVVEAAQQEAPKEPEARVA
jgi:hypothetical protein